jgi:AraC family transcriptional regulator of arabinose operon
VLHGLKQIFPAHSVILYDCTTAQHYGATKSQYIDDWIYFSMDPKELLWWEKNNIILNEMIILKDSTPITSLIQEMSYEFYSTNPSKEESLSLYMQLLSYKIKDLSLSGHLSTPLSFYNQLVQLRSNIYNNPGSNWRINTIACQMALSTSYLQHTYKNLFGVPITRDVIASRIALSKKLLSGTNFNMQKIAMLCGYEYDVFFMRQFKKETQLTPTEYRRLNQKPNTEFR